MYNKINRKDYTNFVKPKSPTKSGYDLQKTPLSGTEARNLYLEEVKEGNDPVQATCEKTRFDKRLNTKRKKNENGIQFCEKELFVSVQNDDIDKLSQILDAFPDKINVLDKYGWSLLMIACQANAIGIVQELLKHGIDISVRDKAGNSARSLVIKNRNFLIADLLVSYKSFGQSIEQTKPQASISIEEYICDICNNKKFSNKQQHLSSTLHNINASMGKKIPTNYVIPESNKGYQIMLRGGWKKDAGLGPDGSGNKYPIKAIKKTDKSGLGHKRKVREKILIDEPGSKFKNLNIDNYHKNRLMEINFRRQFY